MVHISLFDGLEGHPLSSRCVRGCLQTFIRKRIRLLGFLDLVHLGAKVALFFGTSEIGVRPSKGLEVIQVRVVEAVLY